MKNWSAFLTGALAWCLILFFMCGVSSAQGELVVGVDDKDWAGHYEWKGDVLLGVDADIVRAVAGRLGYQVKFLAFPWKRVLQMIELNELDAVLDVAPIKARKEYLHYVETPISTEGTAFWVKKGSTFSFDGAFTPEMRLGLMFGTDWSDRFAKQGTPTVKRFNSFRTAFANLEVDHIDMFGNYLATTQYYAAKHGYLDKIELLDVKYEGLPYYLAFSTKDGYAALAERFSKELKLFYKSSEYQDVLQKHDAVDLVGDYK